MNDRARTHSAFARLLSSAVVSQALLSAANFGIGLILIRSAADVEYAYYVLAASAILLVVSLQNALFNPALALRLNRLDRPQRADLIGGLYREQQRLLRAVAALVLVGALGLWSVHMLDRHTVPLVLGAAAAAIAILHREYFRMVLLSLRRPQDVLRTDIFYVVLIVAGAYAATFTSGPALAALLALCLAAVASGVMLSRTLRRDEPWNVAGARGILRDIAPLAAWSTAGAAIHWTFSQGYVYLVAGTLDIAAVSAIAATRLLLMPVNLLSTGIGSLMLPLASGWLHRHGAALVWRRLCLFATGLAVAMLCYFCVLWFMRDWIFTVILKKQFAQADALLILWGALFLVMVVRDQLVYLLAAQGQFRQLTLLTAASAAIALVASYGAMLQFGVVGALGGLLIGELISTAGIVVLSLRRKAAHAPIAAPQPVK